MEIELLVFRRQYLQLLEPEFLQWPPKQLLKDPSTQLWLSKIFGQSDNERLPPPRYQLRVLKQLVARIEDCIEDPEEDGISDELVSKLSGLVAVEIPSEAIAVQQTSHVTFTCLPSHINSVEDPNQEPTVTLLERPNLICGSQTTGFRTWEAALHLGSFLLSPEGTSLIKNKNILELGAGTGFPGILCAKHLGAKHATSTDGATDVVEALRENFFLNGLDNKEFSTLDVLKFGHALKGTWVEDDCNSHPYNVAIGSDLMYHKGTISALASTLRYLFELRPNLLVVLSGVLRNVDTFQAARDALASANFTVTDVDFDPVPLRKQVGLFYATAVPIKIFKITKRPAG
ncbi:hypothetical protein K470DRAFT_256065 [Piedraia hortae CBS 480.64]|uniref:S-adenosyl-L-methionine-dependent methyltransferase n=1 Tax=Piedraia hortae CBS 480.64 TaxID=1314780 RepID=A0A6A7C4J5_9PEZI|nr:hypothetical protein K470DRAFT_256065 [Piedraia hortae CBS 480.64]